MVSEYIYYRCEELLEQVLILVLVEDGLRGEGPNGIRSLLGDVLILVLVEDGLRGQERTPRKNNSAQS